MPRVKNKLSAKKRSVKKRSLKRRGGGHGLKYAAGAAGAFAAYATYKDLARQAKRLEESRIIQADEAEKRLDDTITMHNAKISEARHNTKQELIVLRDQEERRMKEVTDKVFEASQRLEEAVTDLKLLKDDMESPSKKVASYERFDTVVQSLDIVLAQLLHLTDRYYNSKGDHYETTLLRGLPLWSN